MTDVKGGVVTAYFAGLSTALSTVEAGRCGRWLSLA